MSSDRTKPFRAVTLLDLRLGLVELTPEQTALIREKVVPILVRTTQRLLMERPSAADSMSSNTK